MAARSARSRAGMAGLFEATATIGRPASISAWRFVPSPDTSTPIKGEGSRPQDPPDHQLAVLRLGDDGAEADAEVEDAAQLVLVDLAAEPLEDGRPRPGVPVQVRAQALGDRPRQVALDAAPRDVGERVRALAEPPDVVEVEPRRREQVVALVVLELEHTPHEREAVRVDARRREADDRVPLLDL